MHNVNSTTQTHLPENVESRIMSCLGNLAMLPATATQAMKIARAPESSIDEFSNVVQRAPKLASDVLSMANSALYSTGVPIINLRQAVQRLGFQQCQNLLLSTAFASLMNRIDLQQEWIRESLCKHAFVTALIATRVNDALNLGFRGEEFTVGLMHDFGRLLLSMAFPDEFAGFDPMTFSESGSELENETFAVGTDHCEVGAWFAEHNGLPQILTDAIRCHHTPDMGGDATGLAALTATADHMANYLQIHGTSEGYDVGENRGVALLPCPDDQDVCTTIDQYKEQLMEGAVNQAEPMIYGRMA